MNKLIILAIVGILVASSVLIIDPETNDVSIDEEGSAALYCATVHALVTKILDDVTFLDFLNDKQGCVQ